MKTDNCYDSCPQCGHDMHHFKEGPICSNVDCHYAPESEEDKLRVELKKAKEDVAYYFQNPPSQKKYEHMSAELANLRTLLRQVLSYEEKAEMMPADLVQGIRDAVELKEEEDDPFCSTERLRLP